MKSLPRFALLLAFALTGCSAPTATVKGKLLDGGQPVGPDGLMVALNFHPLKPDGTVDKQTSYSAVLNGDGSFQIVESGGTLPPGDYRVVITAAAGGPPDPKKKAKASPAQLRFAPFTTVEGSKLKVTVAAGGNDLTIDLAK